MQGWGVLEGRGLALKTTGVRDTEQMRTPSEKYHRHLCFAGKPIRILWQESRLDGIEGFPPGWVVHKENLEMFAGDRRQVWRWIKLVGIQDGKGGRVWWHGKMKHLLVLKGRSSTLEIAVPTVGSVFFPECHWWCWPWWKRQGMLRDTTETGGMKEVPGSWTVVKPGTIKGWQQFSHTKTVIGEGRVSMRKAIADPWLETTLWGDLLVGY